jgi:spermidine/putrescine-binding protein
MALLADGVAPDKIYPLDLDRAFKKMDELRPHIRSYWTSGDQPVQGVSNGEFVAGTAWNGRVNAAMKGGKPVAPSWNGALLRVSWNFILKGAPHPRAAEALLYYMQRTEGQAELAKLSGYTGGNKNVVKSVDAELAEALATSPITSRSPRSSMRNGGPTTIRRCRRAGALGSPNSDANQSCELRSETT